jgi:hypothetical protein
MHERREDVGVTGELQLEHHYSEFGWMGKDDYWYTVKLLPHSQLEVKLTIDSSQNSHLGRTRRQFDAKEEYIIEAQQLTEFIRAHGKKL